MDYNDAHAYKHTHMRMRVACGKHDLRQQMDATSIFHSLSAYTFALVSIIKCERKRTHTYTHTLAMALVNMPQQSMKWQVSPCDKPKFQKNSA